MAAQEKDDALLGRQKTEDEKMAFPAHLRHKFLVEKRLFRICPPGVQFAAGCGILLAMGSDPVSSGRRRSPMLTASN
jgi:hypothetical protein